MAQPLRWVLIGLSIKLGLSIREVESFTVSEIREYMAMLQEMADPTKSAKAEAKQQTPEEMMAAFSATFAKKD